MLIDFRQLFPHFNLTFSGVLHLGGNVGEEFPVYNQLGIKKQIWVEANPDIFPWLKRNISSNPQALACCFAVGDEDKKTVLHVANNGSQSSSLLELGTHKIAHPDVRFIKDIPVEMKRIDTVFSEDDLKGIDLLNCDLQGFELNAMKGMGSLLNQFKAVYTEINVQPLYVGCALLNEVESYLNSFGFVRAAWKMYESTGWGDCLFIKRQN